MIDPRVDDTPRSLAHAAMARVPRRTPWRWLWSKRVPSLPEIMKEVSDGRCPRCGRLLPGGGKIPSVKSYFVYATLPIHPSRYELIHSCLVDGPRQKNARDFDERELLDAGRFMADELARKGWKPWSKMLRWALARPDDDHQAEALAQALEVFERWGPANDTDALETLIASLGPHCPTS